MCFITRFIYGVNHKTVFYGIFLTYFNVYKGFGYSNNEVEAAQQEEEQPQQRVAQHNKEWADIQLALGKKHILIAL